MSVADVPLTTFRFEVVLNLDTPVPGMDVPLCDGSFAEADGLDMSMQPKTLSVGGVNDRQIHLVGPVTYGNLTLKRGMTTNLQLWTWFLLGTRAGSVLTAHGEVTMWASDGTPAIQFTLTGCLPTRLRAPSLNAATGLVAVEELTLVYEQLVVVPPGAVGSAVAAAVGLMSSTPSSLAVGLGGGL